MQLLAESCRRLIGRYANHVAVSLLDGRQESEELLDMNDVDVIDLQADGSVVNLSGNNIVSFSQFFSQIFQFVGKFVNVIIQKVHI